jgi:hypothetical protein
MTDDIVRLARRAFRFALLPVLALSANAGLAQSTATTINDGGRWRILATVNGATILIANDSHRVAGSTRSIATFTVMPQPDASGIDGMLTRYEVDCEANTINDLGGTAFAGTTERASVASSTNGRAQSVRGGTVYFAVSNFVCTGQLASGERRMLPGLSAAIAYAREHSARH